jgi:hypothetical protein
MKKKKDNNLVMVEFEDGRKNYYTSWNRAAMALNIVPVSAQYNASRGNTLKTENGNCKIRLIDGGDIQYKYINV